MDLSRRQILAALAGAALLSPGAVILDRAIAEASLPETTAWQPRAGEVQPAIKARAARLIEAVGAWTASAGTLSLARQRAVLAGFDPTHASALAGLLHPSAAAVVQVRDAQFGGLLTSSASVLVVVDQWTLGDDGTVHAGGATFDVRLQRASPHWRIVDVLPARPGAPADALSRAAKRVLADTRIQLPSSAKADVRAGRIHDSVLAMLSSMAASHVVDVSVLRSGHPLHVFGTSRTSDHPRGRAVDIWALDHRPLVVPGNHALATWAMRAAVAHGAYNVGGPVRLSGRQYFSDLTHRDHVHLGFDA
ncbi:MAG: hypothetical protein WC005_08940 [Candidatus Nanopelagicales bacterium]